MKALIEVRCTAKNCEVIPTCGRDYTNKRGGDYFVDMSLVNGAGCDVFLHIPCSIGAINIPYIAFGMDTCVQVKLKYPWTKHNIVSNVPIKTYCEKGYAESIFDVIYHRIKGLINITT